MIIPRYYGLTITYISREISIEHPSVGLASLAQLCGHQQRSLFSARAARAE